MFGHTWYFPSRRSSCGIPFLIALIFSKWIRFFALKIVVQVIKCYSSIKQTNEKAQKISIPLYSPRSGPQVRLSVSGASLTWWLTTVLPALGTQDLPPWDPCQLGSCGPIYLSGSLTRHQLSWGERSSCSLPQSWAQCLKDRMNK